MRNPTLLCLCSLTLAACNLEAPETAETEQASLTVATGGLTINPGDPVPVGTPVGSWFAKRALPRDSLNYDFSPAAAAPRYADAVTPDLAADATGVYAAWKEEYLWRAFYPAQQAPASPTDHEPIYVSHWNGTTWAPLGGDLNRMTAATGNGTPLCGRASGNSHPPALAVAGGIPYVAFIENVAAQCTAPVNHQLFVERFDASNGWQLVGGGPVPAGAGREIPSTVSLTFSGRLSDKGGLYDLVLEGGVPYLAVVEHATASASYFLIVKYWAGASGWVQVGNAVNLNPAIIPQDPQLRFLGSGPSRTPHLAWREDSRLYVRRVQNLGVVASGNLLGPLSIWERVGPATPELQVSPTGMVATLSLTGTSYPILAWSEKGASTASNAGHALVCTDVYVKWYDAGADRWRLWSGLVLAGSTGALTRACGDGPPFVDVSIAGAPNGTTFVATAATDYQNGGSTASSARVKVQYWNASSTTWRDLGAAVDQSQSYAAETHFVSVALALAGNAPWIAAIRQQPLPYLTDPYGVVRPAHQLSIHAFE